MCFEVEVSDKQEYYWNCIGITTIGALPPRFVLFIVTKTLVNNVRIPCLTSFMYRSGLVQSYLIMMSQLKGKKETAARIF